ncbi:U3 small nucleolar RNA-associated protein 25 [Paragonimus westermani]|uniref:U3 small nucleolar RNA-associated protein 25 n=1 Tax=Paragonimus westermani TaxID=34504 RepID=A0A5J4N9W2_9TREM|nr:U3 small nucleolar RNA-associated protein 25 [Paragonimus westermani]
MSDDLTDAPIEGSAFLRHFSYPFEKLESTEPVYVHTVVDPFIGWFKTSACNSSFPWLNTKNAIEPNLDNHDATVFKMISNYEDLLFCRRYPDNETVRVMYCAHALNHALSDLRDQGFHRARILILAPTKESARRIVRTFLSLMPKGSTVSHRRRFERDFGPAPGEADQEKRKGYKPKDYQDWFSYFRLSYGFLRLRKRISFLSFPVPSDIPSGILGNTSDHFRIGISFAKKSVKLYSAFVDSDLILASPLGLQTIIDEEK